MKINGTFSVHLASGFFFFFDLDQKIDARRTMVKKTIDEGRESK
jgi:hypothetical protein